MHTLATSVRVVRACIFTLGRVLIFRAGLMVILCLVFIFRRIRRGIFNILLAGAVSPPLPACLNILLKYISQYQATRGAQTVSEFGYASRESFEFSQLQPFHKMRCHMTGLWSILICRTGGSLFYQNAMRSLNIVFGAECSVRIISLKLIVMRSEYLALFELDEYKNLQKTFLKRHLNDYLRALTL